MAYEDFIYFMLSEEDKANERSVRYWFRCLDLDGDNVLKTMELRHFYSEQQNRLACLGHEVVPFADMLCQMLDMIKPKVSCCSRALHSPYHSKKANLSFSYTTTSGAITLSRNKIALRPCF